MDSNERRVCIAMDGSQFSDFAFEWYMKQIRHQNDYVILAHCYERHSGLHSAMGTADVQSVCAIMQEEEMDNKKLQQQFEERMKKAGVTGCVKGKFGKPGEVVVSIAHEEHAEMIICGNRGQGKVRRTFMGSVSDYIVHHSDVPVVVCRHKSHHHH